MPIEWTTLFLIDCSSLTILAYGVIQYAGRD